MDTTAASLTTPMTVEEGDRWLARYERYRLKVSDYVTFHEQGFLVVRGLVPREDVEEMRAHSEEIISGRIGSVGGTALLPGQTASEAERRLLRIHMLHRDWRSTSASCSTRGSSTCSRR